MRPFRAEPKFRHGGTAIEFKGMLLRLMQMNIRFAA
jgi:hypothetical protein